MPVCGGMDLILCGSITRVALCQVQILWDDCHWQYVVDIISAKTARKIETGLTSTCWFERGMNVTNGNIHVCDAGIYDMLLHTRDISFDVQYLQSFIFNKGYIL